MALRDINLIPAEVAQKRRASRHVIFWAGIMGGCLVLVLYLHLAAMYTIRRNRQPPSAFVELDRALQETLLEISTIQADLERLSYVKTLKSGESYAEIVWVLSGLLNDRTWLGRLSIERLRSASRGQVVTMSGFADTKSDLGAFLERLAAEPRFERVDLAYAKDVSAGERTGGREADSVTLTSFEITCVTGQ